MNRNIIYNTITNRIISKLQAGVIPWRRSWKIGIPSNYVSKRAYTGINFLSLLAVDHASPYYITFLQAKQLGIYINPGEKGQLIVFGEFY